MKHSKEVMNAIVLKNTRGLGGFSMEKIDIPEPTPNEIRIRIKAAAFNPVDLKTRKGFYNTPLPLILGVDCSGVVDKIGTNVKKFQVGDAVYGILFGQGSNGSYSQYACVPYNFLSKKPLRLSFEDAACIPLAALTAYRATSFLKHYRTNGATLVIGATGGVGAFAIPLIRHFYNNSIFVLARTAESIDFLCKNMDIPRKNILLSKNLDSSEIKKKLTEMNNNQLFHATFDFVGKENTHICEELTEYSGHTVSIVPEEEELDSTKKLRFSKNLINHNIFVGAESYSNRPELWTYYESHFHEINKLIDTGCLPIPFYTNLGKLEVSTVQMAHTLMELNHVKGKLVMTVE